MSSILDAFGKEMNMNLKVLVNEPTYDEETASFVDKWVPKEGDGFPCILYSKAIAEKYFGEGMWDDSVKYVACLRPVGFDISGDNQVLINDTVQYAIDPPDDVAGQGEVLLIALRSLT